MALVIKSDSNLEVSCENNFVCVEPVKIQEEKTASGLVLHTAPKQDAYNTMGQIISVGPKAIGYAVGEVIIIPRDKGIDMRLGGATLTFIKAEEILAKLNDVEIIDENV